MNKKLINEFKALSDETRFEIVNLLLKTELCVCEIERKLNMSEPRISRHLKILRQAGIIANEKKGQKMIYRIKQEFRRTNLFKVLKNAKKENI